MKKSLVRSRLARLSGFTLVELLVVIGIIAILASVILFAGGAALRSAKRAKANNTATQIQTAALAYYTEYGVYPVTSDAAASTDDVIADTDATHWQALLYGLCGNVEPYNGSTTVPADATPNTRGIAFLTLRNTDVDSKNGPLNPLPPNANELYFFIAMDNDYDGILGGTSTSTGKLPNFTTAILGAAPPMTGSSTAGVAVWANCNGNATTQNPNFWVHTY
jgi:prepilin-type N-terminal cleavage/methylation domain-containing protein